MNETTPPTPSCKNGGGLVPVDKVPAQFFVCDYSDTRRLLLMRIVGETLDDLLYEVFKKLLMPKKRVVASRGSMREHIGAHLILKDVRARFSRTEQRATLFSCIAETLWYLSGSDKLEFIEHHINGYAAKLEVPSGSATTPGAYGPRLFAPDFETSEIGRVIRQLRDKPTTRKAVVQILSNNDLDSFDPPCTCVLQFFVRSSKLHLVVFMRSNDAYIGLPHDIFAFTWIQEMVARSLGRETGYYQHMVGSLHLYDNSETSAKTFLAEGWQQKASMPEMPTGDPWPSINWLLQIEEKLRTNSKAEINWDGIDPYWQDIARLLQVRELIKQKKMRDIVKIKNEMMSLNYDDFIRSKAQAIANPTEAQLFPDFMTQMRKPDER